MPMGQADAVSALPGLVRERGDALELRAPGAASALGDNRGVPHVSGMATAARDKDIS